MHDLLAPLVEQLEGFGLHVHLSPDADDAHALDLTVELTRGGSRQVYAWELKRGATMATVGPERQRAAQDLAPLLGTALVSARSADSFRRAGIQYVDVAGNAWIQFGDVLVDVRGRRPSGDLPPGPDTSGGNLFSAARAQVGFALLQWPRLWKQSQRQVAQAAGVSLGQANNTLALLREAGFGPGGHRGQSELLDLWVAAFPSGLARKLVLAKYRGSTDGVATVNAEDPLFLGALLSGEAAADDLVHPATLTIYVDHLDPHLPVKNRWRSDGRPNITVGRKFWTTPPDAAHDDDEPLVGLRTAPVVLVYADLMASDDPRVRSVAPDWRGRIAQLEQDL